MENSVDYDIEFLDNVNVGVGTAKISGKGNFKGITRKHFNIVDEEFLTYIFSADGAQVVNGKLTQNVEKAEQITVPIVEKRGYEFLHWTFNGITKELCLTVISLSRYHTSLCVES